MNQKLQQLLNSIQQSAHLSDDEKIALAKNIKEVDKEIEIISFKFDRTEKVKRTTAILLEETIEELEQKRKAVEAQNRELEIETALERVRAVAMAMKHSDELASVCEVMFKQLALLGFTNIRNAQIAIENDATQSYLFYVYSGSEKITAGEVGYNSSSMIKRLYKELGKSGDGLYEKEYAPSEMIEWRKWRTLLTPLTDPREETAASLCFYLYAIGRGNIGISTFSAITNEQIEIVKRFKKVFELSYTRFDDLQKAEAQAREAQIEAALEKIRSRSLAMHRSHELKEVMSVMFQKLTELDVLLGTVAIQIFDPVAKDCTFWIGNDKQEAAMVKLPYDEKMMTEGIYMKDSWDAWKREESFFNKVYSNEDKNRYFQYVFANNGPDVVPPAVREFLLQGNNHVNCLIVEKKSALFADSWNNRFYTEDKIDVLKRTAKVFDQAYVRFLDLQKAEAQTREAQIETALERVRSKTMAMHNSTDVGDTAAVMVDELKKLGIETVRCGIGIMHEPGDMEVWTIRTDENNKTDIIIGWLDMNIHPLLHDAFVSWRNKNESYSYELKDEDLLNYYNAINHYPGYPIRYDISTLPKLIHHNEFRFAEGILFAFSLEQLSQEQRKIFKRFAGVFGQTYRRYLDLQKAEAQAREAQIETALERVRSRTLAMQKSDELAETAAVVFRQLISLGIEPNRLYIGIVQDESGDMEMWATDEDGTRVGKKFTFNKTENISVQKLYDGWKAQKKSVVVDMQGDELEDYLNYLKLVMKIPFKGGLTQKRRVQSVAFFSKGFIGMASPDCQGQETIQLLERFAAVFNLTYTRFNDLQIAEAHAIQAEEDLVKLQTEKKRAEDALTELRETQKQLIQSEKMASLGELTAGIAHEIQNPLNFVNNFSEVSNELIEELKAERHKAEGERDKALEDELLNDLAQNLEKINHHGKRADAIVKGMLQHSRSSAGQKEPTDINALADEYLRLAYHGLRAKDKSLNAILKTGYDESIGNVNIVPQDIGRVILNLITNAFYATNERRKAEGVGYEPAVSVGTKKLINKVEIKVTDNGGGIPKNIVDKIFQPFFTTKPTGQGTGLGLSLAYDIVKAHGGELKVETKENEARPDDPVVWGTTFIIQLPV